MYLALFVFNSTQLCQWEISSKQHVGKEQGIEALDNCDPEPEHRLLYQVEPRLRGWKGCGVGFPRHVFCIICFFTKTNTYK